MPHSQLLHLVIGGELEDVETVKFRDLSKIDLVGAYASYGEVDNALMRYFIIHAHKLLNPDEDDDHH